MDNHTQIDVGRIKFRISHVLLLMTLAASFLIAIRSWGTCYQTYGMPFGVIAVFSAPLFLVISVLCLVYPPSRLPIAIATIIICITFSFSQMENARLLRVLQAEARSISSFVEKYRLKHGRLPTDLSDYRSNSLETRDYIEYYREPYGQSGYLAFFNPTGDRNYGHYYSPTHGFYFEDD